MSIVSGPYDGPFMCILPVTQKSTSRTGHGGAEMRDEGHGKKKLMKTCEQKATFH